MKKKKMIEKIKSFKELNYKGWNGYSAEPISEKLINKSLELINKFKVTPFVAPTGRSSIQFEWESNDETLYLEIEIFENCIKIFKMTGDKEETEEYSKLSEKEYKDIDLYINQILIRNKSTMEGK